MCDTSRRPSRELTKEGIELTREVSHEVLGLMTALRLPGGGELAVYDTNPVHGAGCGQSLGRRTPAVDPIPDAVPWAARALRRPARAGLAQGAGSRRVDALPSVIPATPVARRGLLTSIARVCQRAWSTRT